MSNAISKQILEEMLELSVEVIHNLDKAKLPQPVVSQLIRSVTSIGANYSEAQDASSKRDFINKIYISKKEAAETVYWLKLVCKLGGDLPKFTELEDKTQHFVMILQKIINSSRTQSLQDKS